MRGWESPGAAINQSLRSPCSHQDPPHPQTLNPSSKGQGCSPIAETVPGKETFCEEPRGLHLQHLTSTRDRTNVAPKPPKCHYLERAVFILTDGIRCYRERDKIKGKKFSSDKT